MKLNYNQQYIYPKKKEITEPKMYRSGCVNNWSDVQCTCTMNKNDNS